MIYPIPANFQASPPKTPRKPAVQTVYTTCSRGPRYKGGPAVTAMRFQGSRTKVALDPHAGKKNKTLIQKACDRARSTFSLSRSSSSKSEDLKPPQDAGSDDAPQLEEDGQATDGGVDDPGPCQTAEDETKKDDGGFTGANTGARTAPTLSSRIYDFQHNYARDAMEALYYEDATPSAFPGCCLCARDPKRCTPSPDSVYRCSDCFHRPILCKECILQSHSDMPFHSVRRLNRGDRFWAKCSLGELGLIINLGHEGKRCDRALYDRWMTVVHSRGVHRIRVRFCSCTPPFGKPTPDFVQLIRTGLWPATWKVPTTAFTFDVLRLFRLLSVQAHTNAHDFMQCLLRLTDDLFPGDCEDRYDEFLMAVRQFNYLELCRRHNQEPKADAEHGSLATLCPCCPHIGINIDPKWKDRKADIDYLDWFFYAVDGNFVSNQKEKRRDLNDFPLSMGAAYFAHERETAKYIASLGPLKVEHSTCHKFAAMGYAGHFGAVSGTIGVTCARHMFILPGGGVDLQKGERFANADYAVLSGTQKHMGLSCFVSAYDINCQYRIRWYIRTEELLKRRHEFKHLKYFFSPTLKHLAGIGKFHLPAHAPQCRYKYSFRYLRGVGMTDGEAVERVWSGLNGISLRTREMASGHRHDTINDFHEYKNTERTHRTPDHLARKLADAMKMLETAKGHLETLEYQVITNKEHKLGPEKLQEWKLEEKEWLAKVAQKDANGNQHMKDTLANPYDASETVRLSQKALTNEPLLHEIKTPLSHGLFTVIEKGIELQETKAAVLVELSEYGDSSPEANKELVKSLKRQIESWRQKEALYMVPLYLEAANDLPHRDREEVIRYIYGTPAEDVLRWGSPNDIHAPAAHDDTSEDQSNRKRKGKRATATPKKKSKSSPSDQSQPAQVSTAPGSDKRPRSEQWHEVNALRIDLPSSQHRAIRDHLILKTAVSVEYNLRRAKAAEQLDDLRAHLITYYGVMKVKYNVHGQGLVTRAQGAAKRQWKSMRAAVDAYRCTYSALRALGMEEGDPVFKELRQSDIQPFTMYSADEELAAMRAKLGESRVLPSWLWERWDFISSSRDASHRACFVEGQEQYLKVVMRTDRSAFPAFRVYWFRSSASKSRWEEEVRLLEEEMRRTVRFFKYYKKMWSCTALKCELFGKLGRAAYAWKEVHRYERLLDRCRAKFDKTVVNVDDVECPYEPEC
ncbi:hypothetical protein NM688_g1418 [Phlebia brevispora]|uniref:Uncharacterized protein n=1 Tax=Phlebia brevispora TaxID=194682 RepID=A0ACC1TBC3_9APHY|nr:hypothetical protein NM688_g1418 [Phlebia brevispora]